MESKPPLFKIRCSQIGKIMGGALGKPTEKQLQYLAKLEAKEKRTEIQENDMQELIAKRDAKPELQAGAKTYLQEWMKDHIYMTKKEFSSKYTAKGVMCEPRAIELVAEMMGYGEISKNETQAEDEFMTGCCDLHLIEIIEEIKNSWSPYTFPLFEIKLPESDYFFQLQGYMHLYDKKRGAVNYCLINAPEELIEQAARKASFEAGFSEVDMELWDEVQAKMTFDNVDKRLKHRRFEFDRDDTIIQAIKDRVVLCREYIETEWNRIVNPVAAI